MVATIFSVLLALSASSHSPLRDGVYVPSSRTWVVMLWPIVYSRGDSDFWGQVIHDDTSSTWYIYICISLESSHYAVRKHRPHGKEPSRLALRLFWVLPAGSQHKIVPFLCKTSWKQIPSAFVLATLAAATWSRHEPYSQWLPKLEMQMIIIVLSR